MLTTPALLFLLVCQAMFARLHTLKREAVRPGITADEIKIALVDFLCDVWLRASVSDDGGVIIRRELTDSMKMYAV